MTQIILLNGVGSAGKSSIAKALQAMSSQPILHVQMDAFIEMLPAEYGDHPDAWTYSLVPNSSKPEIAIREGPLGRRLLQGMRHAVHALAAQGLDLVVDDVLMGRSDPGVSEYADLLSEFQFFRVGVFASLETLEIREKQRGDRLLGLARWQFDRVHEGMDYDLEVQTDTMSPAAVAEAICKKFGIHIG